MTDVTAHRLERRIREMTVGVRAGSPQMDDLRASLMADLDAIRGQIQRQEAHRLEVLIDRLAGRAA